MILTQEVETENIIPKIIQPRTHKASICVWADLTVDDIDRVNESLNADHIKQVLADVLHLDDYKDNPRNGILMDLFQYTLQYARTHNFSKEKTSVLFSIIKKTHEVCIETPFGNLDETFKYFKDLILCHSVNRPPHSIELFNADEVRKVTEYAINTYFRHFKMYKYAFTPLVKLDLSITYDGMPMSPTPEESEEPNVSEEPKEEVDNADPTEEQATQPDLSPEKDEEIDESPARKELRAMIQNFLSDEIKKVKLNVDDQIKTSEESLSKMIDAVEGVTPSKKNSASPKGKKK